MSALPPLMRMSAAMFSAAALLGMLRFSGIYIEARPHMLMSMIAGVAAFPGLATAIVSPMASAVTRWRLALVSLAGAAVLGGAITILSGSRIYLNVCALGSILLIAVIAYRRRNAIQGIAALLMLGGSLSFTLNSSPVPVLQPADVLHLALAVGFSCLSYGVRTGKSDLLR